MTRFTPALLASLLAVSTLAACGVDGAPQKPEAKPGLTVSGDARAGVVYTK